MVAPALIPSPTCWAAPSTRTDALAPRPGTDGRSGALEAYDGVSLERTAELLYS